MVPGTLNDMQSAAFSIRRIRSGERAISNDSRHIIHRFVEGEFNRAPTLPRGRAGRKEQHKAAILNALVIERCCINQGINRTLKEGTTGAGRVTACVRNLLKTRYLEEIKSGAL